jgi:predicted nucleotidyltransferase
MYSNEIIEYLKNMKKPASTQQMILFGSVARHNYRPDSDIDIIIISNALNLKNDKGFWAEIQWKIFEKYNVPISFIVTNDLKQLATGLQKEIEKDGIHIWEK